MSFYSFQIEERRVGSDADVSVNRHVTAFSGKTQVRLQIRIRKHPQDSVRQIQMGRKCGVSPLCPSRFVLCDSGIIKNRRDTDS
jgi:hypothetical protein